MMRHYSKPNTVCWLVGLEYGYFVEIFFVSKVYKRLTETQSSALS